jgi:hypothetical protein
MANNKRVAKNARTIRLYKANYVQTFGHQIVIVGKLDFNCRQPPAILKYKISFVTVEGSPEMKPSG